MRERYDTLRKQIEAGLEEAGADSSSLALQIFEFQFETNPPYRAYCEALKRSPATARSWRDIPTVPTDAFKTGLPLCCLPSDQCSHTFLTSGTTGEVRGRHYLPDLHLYRRSVTLGWSHAKLPDHPRLFLSRAPHHLPESSLAWMFAILAENPDGDLWLIREDGTINLSPLENATSSSSPIFLLTTALALRHLFESLDTPLPLPPGSWIFQTGGYKGLSETFDPAALYQKIEHTLSVPPERIVNEYGMTELSSQAYAVNLHTPHHTPPWMKVRVLDPATGRDVAPGETGYLAFCDLANLGSVTAVRTQDFGIAIDEHTFTLLGRDPSALPRGCSRASDSFLQPS